MICLRLLIPKAMSLSDLLCLENATLRRNCHLPACRGKPNVGEPAILGPELKTDVSSMALFIDQVSILDPD